ncbi:MAG TPA: rod shape-determining protein MreC, partial [Candidatus Limnocylindrales bacterium]|nr:rod shape-determining protein MreC [Candidatus Limnocylindrales bacterium]
MNSRQARRRGITFAILIAVTLLLMAFSANPYVQDVQSGLSFALRPFQGAIADVARSVAGVAGAVGEIDELRTENTTLREENDRLANENARLEAVRSENEQLTALVQLQGGLEHETVATRVIGRETLETRRVVILDKGTDAGIEEGDVVIVQGGALAGRVTDAGPTFAKVTLI